MVRNLAASDDHDALTHDGLKNDKLLEKFYTETQIPAPDLETEEYLPSKKFLLPACKISRKVYTLVEMLNGVVQEFPTVGRNWFERLFNTL